MDINKELQKVLKEICDNTFLCLFKDKDSLDNAFMVDSKDDLLEIFNIDSFDCMRNASDMSIDILNDNLIVIPYKFKSEIITDFFVCYINDDYKVTICDFIFSKDFYRVYDARWELSFSSSIIYDKIKRIRKECK